MAGKHDFNIDQGTTWNRIVTIAQDGTPVDLSGFTARMQLRGVKRQSIPDLSLTTENGGITIDTLAGQLTLSISAAQSAGLSGSYFYDLELVTGQTVTRWLEGKIILSDEVTR